METSFSLYQNLTLDQTQTNYSFHNSFIHQRKIFCGNCWISRHSSKFSSTRRLKFQILSIKCCALEQGLKPRPKPKPSIIEANIEKHVSLEDKQMKKHSNSGICAQIEQLVYYKKYREALELFEILEIDGGYNMSNSTYDALVNACVGLRSIKGVKRVLNYMISTGFEPDQYISNRVLLMHVKCGMMIDARRLFDEMPVRNLVSWNTIIGGLIDVGDYLSVFRLFLLMLEDDLDVGSRTFAMMIRASAGLEKIVVGKQIHSRALKMGLGENIFVSCALIDMYSKCGSINDAHDLFNDMKEKTTVGWNSIIAGYALHGYSEEALCLYYKMRDSGTAMDHFTFSILTRICTRLASIENARQAHAGLVRHGFGLDIVANTALVDFYSKWGRIEYARHVFDKMARKNVISWNALIAGYGNHGRGDEAIRMFERMVNEGMVPDHVTFLAVLYACSYSGLLKRGREIFKSMVEEHKVKPRAMHYACMVELLGREGLLDEAFVLIRDAPLKPTANMWAALLTACRVHKNTELGRFAAEKLYRMEPEKLSNYAVLFNIYNSSGELNEAASVINTLERRGLRMVPACTWIEIKKQSHAFLSGDQSHAQSKEIYSKLEELMLEISRDGYVPTGEHFLPDVDEQEQSILAYHSEKLAVAFGLINTNESAALQIVQSHRICNDCHNAVKLIAKVSRRAIVCRDGSRFHHFKDGFCSCGDYW